MLRKPVEPTGHQFEGEEVYRTICTRDNCNFGIYFRFDGQAYPDPRYKPLYDGWFDRQFLKHWRKRHEKQEKQSAN